MTQTNENGTLDSILAELAGLRATVAEQAAKIESLETAQTTVAPTAGEASPTSRRKVLRRLAVAAAGTAAGAALVLGGGSAQAQTGSGSNIGFFAYPGNGAASNLPFRAGVAGAATGDFGDTQNAFTAGVYGAGVFDNGVIGYSQKSTGVVGRSDGAGSGVKGTSALSSGVSGDSFGSGSGVAGTSNTGFGVEGRSTSGIAVRGFSSANVAVQGDSTGGTAVFGKSTDGKGVKGQSDTDIGVDGHSIKASGVKGTSTDGAGVIGTSNNAEGIRAISANDTGLTARGKLYGASLVGTQAPLFLTPASTQGQPATGTHRRGEFFVDKDGKLFFCVADGTPGTWRLLAQ